MSFGQQFLAGQKFAQGLIDTYRDAQQRREFDEIAKAKPVESDGFTAADGDQMRAMATAINPETGKPYYDIQDNGQGGLQVRNNFAYEGQDGTTVEPGSITAMRPKRVTDFLGQRYEGNLDADRLDSLRYRAMADVIGKDDPVRGMQMRRDMKRDEREDKRFTWEEQAQPLKQRGLELAASAGERTERQGVRSDDIQKLDDAIAQMPREALEIYASKLNTNGSQYPMLYTGQTKDGFKFITTDPDSGKPTGKEFVLNEAQLRQMAGASVLGMAGYGQESMARLSSAHKDIADYIKTWNDTQAKVATSHNDALHKGNQDRVAQQNANSADAARRTSIGLAQQRAAMDRMGAAKYFEGDDGKVYASIPTMGKNGLAFQTVEVNPQGVGLRLPNARAGQPTKPVKVPEAGEKFMVDGALKVTDGQGGYIDPKGVLPDMRGVALKKAGIPDEMVGQLPWNADGTKVLFGDMAYDVRDPKDMRALREDYKRLAGNTIALEEANRQDNHLSNNPRSGFGPDITMRPPAGMPSIYADPAAREAYRNQQGR